jgi:carboxylesterase type B
MTDEEVRQLAHKACGEEINWNMRQFAAAQGPEGLRVLLHADPDRGRAAVAPGRHAHGGYLVRLEQSQGQPTQTWNDVDVKLADQMSSYWVNFISRGDPNGSGLPRWPAYKDLATGRVMVLGDTPVAEPAPPPKLAFYSAAFRRLLKTDGTN